MDGSPGAALLVDEVLPEQPVRQWVLSAPYPLRSLTRNGNVRYPLKTPYRDGTTHVIFIPGFLPSTLRLFKIAPGDFVSHWTSLRGWRPQVAQTAGQPHSLARGVCAKQRVSRAGDTGQAGQGRSVRHDSGPAGAHASRTPCRDDMGATPEASLRHRYRDLPGLWWGGTNCFVHRRP